MEWQLVVPRLPLLPSFPAIWRVLLYRFNPTSKHFSEYRILRTATEKRIFKKIRENPASETLNSYLGLLKNGNSFKTKERIFSQLYSF